MNGKVIQISLVQLLTIVFVPGNFRCLPFYWSSSNFVLFPPYSAAALLVPALPGTSSLTRS